MSISETDPQAEVLKSIATTLKGIQNSLEQLTGAVEGVAESIEKAHEPEGDLGVHLVGALKDLTSALHKRAQQERSQQPQLGRHDHRQPRRQENRDRHENRQHQEQDDHSAQDQEFQDDPETSGENQEISTQSSAEQGDQPRKKAGRSRGRGRRGGKPPAKPAPEK